MAANLKPVIYLLDDSPAVLKHLESVLGREDFKLESLSDPKELLIRVNALPPDVILTDLEMPGMSGIEVCKFIKSDEQFSRVPVILHTSRESKEMILEGYKAGADDFIGKSLDPEIFVAKIRAMVRLKSIRDSLVQLERLETFQTMVATYNHQINSPLSVLQGHVELMKKKVGDEHHKRLDQMQSSIKKIKELLGQLERFDELEKNEYDRHHKFLDFKKPA